jgi:4-amino-4-deoxy-L-arabinose transferase-like glycosyltransferase
MMETDMSTSARETPASAQGGAAVEQCAIAAAFVAFFVAWAAYFAISDLGASIHHDMAEAYAWGREFQLGYSKHPPFWAWVCGAWFAAAPRAGWSFAILVSLNATLGLLGSWRLIGRFANGDKRIAATVLLLLTPLYTFLSYRYNANTILLSVWPWTLFAFVRAIDGGRLRDAVLFGAFVAIAVLSKYYAAILAATCLLAALQHPARARYFSSASPYVSAAVTAALCAPHLWWVIANGAPTVNYFIAETGRNLPVVAGHAADALVGVLEQNAVVVAVVAFVGRSTLPRSLATMRTWLAEPRLRVLATLAIAPLVLTVAAAFVFRNQISTNMMVGVFSLAPLLAIEIVGPADLARLRKISFGLAGTLTIGALAASPIVALGTAWLSNGPRDVEPRKELAAAATDLWLDKTGKPLAFVGGSSRYDTAVAFYSKERPHAFIGLDFHGNPSVSPSELANDGLLSVCLKDDAQCREATRALATPQASEVELILAHHFWGHVAKPATFVITVIPPISR